MSDDRVDLKGYLSPRSIAIIGASSNFEGISGKPLRFLKEHGYAGEIYPVNPKYDELAGFPCYKSILDVPGDVDHALISLNYKLVLPVLRQCVEKGVRFATIFSSGFAESGEEGKALQAEMADLAGESGLRICGPNCQGSVNLVEKAILGFSASLGLKPVRIGPVGYVTQSGALGYSIFNLAWEAGVGFRYIASTGNEVDLHTLDFMEHMLEDPEITILISYLEGIKDGRQFDRLAGRALELGKPIVTLKVGRTEVGTKAASSHTGTLTGSDEVFDGFFRQKGVIRVDDIEAMIDIAALMEKIPALPAGTGLGVITTSGGGGILAADEAIDLGLEIPELDEETRRVIEQVIPDYGSALNPVDVTAQVINEAEDFNKVLEAMLARPEIHALVVVVTQITGPQGKQMAEDMVAWSRKSDKPITVAWTTCDALVGDNLAVLAEGGIRYYKSPVRAVRAMGALMRYAAFQREWLAAGGASAPEIAVPEDAAAGARAMLERATGALTEHQGKELLSLYGIPVTQEETAASADAAAAAAARIGFPVALKILSPDIMHKTEAGGLALNLESEEEVRATFDAIMESARNYKPEARLEGVLVQEMVRGGTEVIVGVSYDAQFGPTVLFGLGGIYVEILKDVSLRVAPLTRREALAMVAETKAAAVLAGARGRPRADVEALADVLVRVGRLAVDLEGTLAELDINPLLVLPGGEGVRVADALVVPRA